MASRPGARYGPSCEPVSSDRDAVKRQVQRAAARAVDGDADEVVPARRFAVGRVHHAGQQTDEPHVVAAFERDALNLLFVNQPGAFAAIGLAPTLTRR